MICTVLDCTAHYACRLRAKSVSVSPSATPSRYHLGHPTFSEVPTRHKEIIGDRLPDGSLLPYRNPDGSPIRRKQYDENRRAIDNQIRAVKQQAAREGGATAHTGRQG